MAKNAEIYKFIVERCRPVTLPAPWRRLASDATCMHPPAESELLRALLENFADHADLRRAGILAQSEGERPQLNARLAQSQALMLPVWDPMRQEIVDLIVDGFSLVGQELPCLGVLKGAEFLASTTDRPQVLFVAATMSDVAVLRTIGLPAAPATGLDQVHATSLAGLLKALSGHSHDDRGAPSDPHQRDLMMAAVRLMPPVRLMLVDWRVTDLVVGPCPEIERIRKHLWQMRTCLAINVDACALWRPTATDLNRIQFSAQHGEQHHVRRHLEKSQPRSPTRSTTRSSARTQIAMQRNSASCSPLQRGVLHTVGPTRGNA